MWHDRLRASQDTERGDRFFDNVPGVYVFSDDKKEKAWGYSPGVPLGQIGAWWSLRWEVFVHRTMKIVKQGTGQWIQPEGSVRLAALWVCCRTHENMENVTEIQERGSPNGKLTQRSCGRRSSRDQTWKVREHQRRGSTWAEARATSALGVGRGGTLVVLPVEVKQVRTRSATRRFRRK